MENPATESVYSLVVDIYHSTQRGMDFTTAERDSFNMALSRVLDPFIEKLDLSDSVIKFTGDGWIISISGGKKIIDLVSLAVLLSIQFNSEMEILSKMTFKPKLDLKVGLAYGMDIKVQFNKRDDFVGDSIRKATRIESICDTNEILIDSTIRSSIFRDFENHLEDKDERIKRFQIKKFETDIDSVYSVGKPKMGQNPLNDCSAKLLLFDALGMRKPEECIIETLKSEAGNQSLSPEDKTSIDLASINLSTVVGKTDDSKIIDKKLKQAGYKRPLSLWNRKINLSTDYKSARSVFEEMKSANVPPTVVTFSILMNKATDYTKARPVFEEMKSAGIDPNVVTFSTLMNKAGTYAEAKSVFDEMPADVRPDVFIFNTLMNKTDNYTDAKSALDEMVKAKVDPNVVTFSTLMNKAGTYAEAKSVFDEMPADVRPDVFIFNTLMNKTDNYTDAKSVFDEMPADVRPDVVTFNTLMDKTDNYTDAKYVFEEMRSAGILPDRETFSTLFSKDIGDCKIEDIHKYYLGLKNCSSLALEPLIKRLFGQGRFQEVYYLILNHPHLPAAIKIVSENFSQAVSIYERFKTKDFYEKNIDYALGIACFDVGKLNKAVKHLKKALTLASTEQRIKHINGLLEQAKE